MPKKYRIMNRVTGEVDEVCERNAQDACRRLGWRIGDCYVVELGACEFNIQHKKYVRSPKPVPRTPSHIERSK